MHVVFASASQNLSKLHQNIFLYRPLISIFQAWIKGNTACLITTRWVKCRTGLSTHLIKTFQIFLSSTESFVEYPKQRGHFSCYISKKSNVKYRDLQFFSNTNILQRSASWLKLVGRILCIFVNSIYSPSLNIYINICIYMYIYIYYIYIFIYTYIRNIHLHKYTYVINKFYGCIKP